MPHLFCLLWISDTYRRSGESTTRRKIHRKKKLLWLRSSTQTFQIRNGVISPSGERASYLVRYASRGGVTCAPLAFGLQCWFARKRPYQPLIAFRHVPREFRHREGGQPTIYFAIGDHVNVSWCRSHTNASGVMAT